MCALSPARSASRPSATSITTTPSPMRSRPIAMRLPRRPSGPCDRRGHRGARRCWRKVRDSVPARSSRSTILPRTAGVGAFRDPERRSPRRRSSLSALSEACRPTSMGKGLPRHDSSLGWGPEKALAGLVYFLATEPDHSWRQLSGDRLRARQTRLCRCNVSIS